MPTAANGNAASSKSSTSRGAGAGGRCEWTFHGYTSSPWEKEWVEAGNERANRICEVPFAVTSIVLTIAGAALFHEMSCTSL